MRFLAVLIVPALAAAQSFDFSVINAAPAPVIESPPFVGTSDSPTIQPYSAIPSIAAFVINSSPLSQRAVDVESKSLTKRDGDCSVQPAGTGPPVHYPDTPAAFENYQPFIAAAFSAPIPAGYSLNFTNLQASTSTTSYLGYTTLNSYDTKSCASKCNAITGCAAFNLYFERDPSLDPNEQSCPNPPSVTNIKCVFWGVPVSKSTATNVGQYRDEFHVVIAGSNGYNAIPTPPSIPGFTSGQAFSGQLNIPLDPTTNSNTYIGAKFFSFGTSTTQTQYFSTEICVRACADQTTYNFAYPTSSGHPTVCNQVVGHSLSKNGVPYGMYCAFYSESWDSSYGTTTFVQKAGDSWAVGSVYSYINSTYAAHYSAISPGGYKGGNCGGFGAGSC